MQADNEILKEKKNNTGIESLLFNKIIDRYFGLIYVDIDTGMAQVIKCAHPDIIGGAGSVILYSDMMKNILNYSQGEEADYIKRISDPGYLVECFKTEDVLYHTYKSLFFGKGKWINSTGQILSRNSDGSASTFALSFNLLDDDACRKEEAKQELSEYTELLRGLSADYSAIYYIDLDTGEYVQHYLDKRMEASFVQFADCTSFLELFSDFVNSELVHEEDRINLKKHLFHSKEDMYTQLRNRKRMSLLFRCKYNEEFLWTEVSIIKCEDVNEEPHNIIVVLADKDFEVRENQRQFAEIDNSNRLIETIVSDYTLVYTANLAENTFRILKFDENALDGEKREFELFSELLQFFIDEIIHPTDKEKMRKEFDFDTLRQKAEQNKNYSLEYRTLIDGISSWNEMYVSYVAEDIIGIAFRFNDLDITKRNLEDRRFDEYLALLAIDVDTQKIKVLKSTPAYKTVDVGMAMDYSEALLRYASLLEGEAKEFFTLMADINYVKQQFILSNKITFSYKSIRFGLDKWIDITGYVLERNEDGYPAMFTLGFSLSDVFAAERSEVQSRLKEDIHMIDGLANGYDTLYYLNIDENICRIILHSSNKSYKRNELITGYDDIFAFFRGNGISKFIHPEDRAFFASFSAESIRSWLENKKKYQYRFRREYENGYKWCEMDVVKYEGINERANAVAIGFAFRDDEIRSEQFLNSCFDILGKRISPDESIDSIIGMVGELYRAERVYVFEPEVKMDSMSITYEWCDSDEQSKMAQCRNIPLADFAELISEFEKNGYTAIDFSNAMFNDGQGFMRRIAVPIMNEDTFVGFIGVVNPSSTIRSVDILKVVSVIIHSEILRRKESDEEHITLGKLADAFVSVYYTDLTNDYMKTWKISDDYRKAYGNTERYSVSMGGYVRSNIAERDRKRCIKMTSPQYVLDQFKKKDRFSVEMTDIMLGYERNFIFDFIKVNYDGSQFVVCCRDISESIEKEREQLRLLEEARFAAEEANKSKTSFLFNMSHDIRTPMNAITGFTSMAKKHIDDKKRVIDYLDKIDTSGMQLLSLVNQVLEMARIESGKIELDKQPMSIHDEYEALTIVLNEQANASGLIFNYSLVNVKHNKVLADQARLSSITLNITGNALKYTPKGGRIDMKLEEIDARREGYATFMMTVEDNGIGMSDEYQKVLFEPFTREKSSTISKIQGTGLGMAIVKQLVDLMGGSIEVESQIGVGSKFTIIIDFEIAKELQSEAQNDTDNRNVSFEGRRVLLVEDNELNREIARDILGFEGIEVDEAQDGSIAVDIMKEKGPDYYDFILMDIQMPVMNGYDATKSIRQMYPDSKIPIIALSANAFSEDRERSIVAGMDAHVSKPIMVKELFGTMRRYLK